MAYVQLLAIRCSLAYKFADTCSNSDTMAIALNPARILVIDDEEDILQAARLLLKRHFRVRRDFL